MIDQSTWLYKSRDFLKPFWMHLSMYDHRVGLFFLNIGWYVSSTNGRSLWSRNASFDAFSGVSDFHFVFRKWFHGIEEQGNPVAELVSEKDALNCYHKQVKHGSSPQIIRLSTFVSRNVIC